MVHRRILSFPFFTSVCLWPGKELERDKYREYQTESNCWWLSHSSNSQKLCYRPILQILRKTVAWFHSSSMHAHQDKGHEVLFAFKSETSCKLLWLVRGLTWREQISYLASTLSLLCFLMLKIIHWLFSSKMSLVCPCGEILVMYIKSYWCKKDS